jgi:putative AdoMet-dependent methyltransferase
VKEQGGNLLRLVSGCHDTQAEHYDQEVRKNLDDYIRENYFAILDRAIEYAEFSAGMSVLDIGVGTGLLTERMPEGLELFGIDISRKMLDKLQEKALPIKLFTGGFLDIPFPRATFDRVVSTFALHHLTPEEKASALREMDRVLKPNGRLVVGDFMVENDRQHQELIQRFRAEGRIDMLRELSAEHFLNIEAEAVDLLHSLGYHIEWERGSTLSWIMRATRAR